MDGLGKAILLRQIGKPMQKQFEKLFIPGDWKRWIAENVLLGNCPDDLKRILVANGCPEELVSLEVDAAAVHPYVAAARSLTRKLKKRDWVLNTARQLETEAEFQVERRGKIDPVEFFQKYYYKNRPVIMTEALGGWPAFERWTPEREKGSKREKGSRNR